MQTLTGGERGLRKGGGLNSISVKIFKLTVYGNKQTLTNPGVGWEGVKATQRVFSERWGFFTSQNITHDQSVCQIMYQLLNKM